MRNIMIVAGLSVAFAVTASANCSVSVDRYAAIPRLAVAAVPEAGSHPLDDSGGGTSIVGLWKTTFTSGGQVVDQGFDQWGSDGTEILNDDPAPSTGNVCLGVYVKSGPYYKLKHPSWTFDNFGNLTGTAIIREMVSLGPGGNTYKGTFTLDIFDLNGNNLAHFAGTIAAQRITVDF